MIFDAGVAMIDFSRVTAGTSHGMEELFYAIKAGVRNGKELLAYNLWDTPIPFYAVMRGDEIRCFSDMFKFTIYESGLMVYTEYPKPQYVSMHRSDNVDYGNVTIPANGDALFSAQIAYDENEILAISTIQLQNPAGHDERKYVSIETFYTTNGKKNLEIRLSNRHSADATVKLMASCLIGKKV